MNASGGFPLRNAWALAELNHRWVKNLLIGATAGSNYDLLQKGIVPQLQKKGYQIKLIEFNHG